MADKLHIDSHKLQYHPKEVNKWLKATTWEKAKKIAPIFVEISPVNYCSHQCCFCGLDNHQGKSKLDTKVLKSTLKSMKKIGVKAIHSAGEGESILHPDLPEIVEYCNKLGIDVGLTTNLSTNKGIDIYLKYCSWIKISLNAGDRKTYKKIHSKDDFSKVWCNVAELRYLKARNNSKCIVGTQIVLLQDNFKSLENLIELSKLQNLDYCVVKPYSQHLSSITQKYKEINYNKFIKKCGKLKKKYDSDRFEVVFRKNSMLNKNKKIEERFSKCWVMPFFFAYIDSYGDVYTCSCFIGDERFCIGNINENSFEEIWYGKRRKENYEMMKSFDVNNCRINCRAAYVNEYLEKLIAPKEEYHLNFI